MIKVKEYLDKNLFQTFESTAELKKNGHYCVNGGWEYPKGIREYERKRFEETSNRQNWVHADQMSFTCNNETLSIRMIFCNGEDLTTYSYLQTYEHIPREDDEPGDVNGYHRRSTDEEIIRFIDERLKRIKHNLKLDRVEKLKRIVDGTE